MLPEEGVGRGVRPYFDLYSWLPKITICQAGSFDGFVRKRRVAGERNYAVKSSFLLSFLESVPEVSAKLKPPATADRQFKDVVKSAQDAAVLVLVY